MSIQNIDDIPGWVIPVASLSLLFFIGGGAMLIKDWLDKRQYAAEAPVRAASREYAAKQQAEGAAQDAARQQSAQDAAIRQTAPPGGASMQYMPMQYMPMQYMPMQYMPTGDPRVQYVQYGDP